LRFQADHGRQAAEDALGKILRGTMKKIADGALNHAATIDDPGLDEIGSALAWAGVVA
jgi:hypothetical protein